MRNNKVGMIPLLYNEYNYGGVLQFYALKRVVVGLGYRIDVVRIENNGLVCVEKYISKNIVKKILLFFYKKTVGKTRKRKIDNVLAGRYEKIEKFRVFFTDKEVMKTLDDSYKEYRAIICGSDQIWNPKWATRRTLLADIPDEVNKVIYAASMGCETMTDSEKAAFKPLVERLQHISVREESAKEVLESFVEREDVHLVLDPTLLLTAEQWNEITKEPDIKERYIFTYFLGDSTMYRPIVEKIALENGLKVVNIPYASGESIDKNIFGDYKIFDASPEEFLGWIKKSDIVFTDSFHACVFSILFKRKYFAFERKGSTNMIGRILTLQNHFHLSNRIVSLEDDIDLSVDIDYSNNEVYQQKKIRMSLEYLRNSIEASF